MTDPTDFGDGDFRFAWGDHICAIFDDHEQQMQVMAPFMAAGIAASQRCVWVGPEQSTNALRDCLTSMGADLPTLEASGQLVLISDVEFYLRDGIFVPERTLELGRVLLEDGQRSGYPTMRIAADVSWLGTRAVDGEQWEQWESSVTGAIAGTPVVAVCQYNRRQVSGSLVVVAFRTHPTVILGTSVQRNPFYVAGEAPAAIDRL
jgi:hypothetical protein